MRLRYTARAIADLNRYSRYLKARSPRGAANVRASIQRAIGLIRHFPEMGLPQPHRGVRKFVAPPYGYAVFYSVDTTETIIDVLAIQHPAALPESHDDDL